MNRPLKPKSLNLCDNRQILDISLNTCKSNFVERLYHQQHHLDENKGHQPLCANKSLEQMFQVYIKSPCDEAVLNFETLGNVDLEPYLRDYVEKPTLYEDYRRVCAQTLIDRGRPMEYLPSTIEKNCPVPRASDDEPTSSKVENIPDIPLDVDISHLDAPSLTTTASSSSSILAKERCSSAPSSPINEDFSNCASPDFRACGSVEVFAPGFQLSDDRVGISTESERCILRTLTPNSESNYPGSSDYDRFDALKILRRPSITRTPHQPDYAEYACSSYRQRRERNNLAVRRCREKSRAQKLQMASENIRLKEENERIRRSLAVALKNVEAYRQKCNYLQELINANRVAAVHENFDSVESQDIKSDIGKHN